MKSFITFGLLACVAMVAGHGATSYAHVNNIVHHGGGGYGGGGGGGGGHGGDDGGHGAGGYGGGDGGHGGHGDYYAHPSYKFEYGVEDHHTGDNKNQWEHRDGDVVKGAYTVAEADGTKRVVEYTADGHNGFNAVVKRIGHASHPAIYGNGGDGHGAGYGGSAGGHDGGLGGYGHGGHGY